MPTPLQAVRLYLFGPSGFVTRAAALGPSCFMDHASLKLETLVVDSAIEHNPQLLAACRAKGVELR